VVSAFKGRREQLSHYNGVGIGAMFMLFLSVKPIPHSLSSKISTNSNCVDSDVPEYSSHATGIIRPQWKFIHFSLFPPSLLPLPHNPRSERQAPDCLCTHNKTILIEGATHYTNLNIQFSKAVSETHLAAEGSGSNTSDTGLEKELDNLRFSSNISTVQSGVRSTKSTLRQHHLISRI
jgi:hypothetical protein